jgi:hypothetical protein
MSEVVSTNLLMIDSTTRSEWRRPVGKRGGDTSRL